MNEDNNKTNTKETRESVDDIKEVKTSTGSSRDINSKTVFKNAELYAQFLRDNVDIPVLKNVRPEDIEDVSERYQPYLGVEFESDTVKKIHLRDSNGNGMDMPLYLISLTEHKSRVDYNVAMQLLRYMVCIWHEYEKEMEAKQKGITKKKSFRYPPILPLVYYEGAAQWTASQNLSDRIKTSDISGGFIPDFRYEVIRIHDYTNEELLARGDEMSLIMMINKVQNAEDFRRLRQSPSEQLDKILEHAQPHIKDIIKDVLYSLMMKMRVPLDEANEYVEMMGESHMGYLFENFEEGDIQKERRNTAEARAEAEAARKEAENAKYKTYISACQEFDCTEEETVIKVMKKYQLSSEEAKEKVKGYWEEK